MADLATRHEIFGHPFWQMDLCFCVGIGVDVWMNTCTYEMCMHVYHILNIFIWEFI